jgi:hypothetical protein
MKYSVFLILVVLIFLIVGFYLKISGLAVGVGSRVFIGSEAQPQPPEGGSGDGGGGGGGGFPREEEEEVVYECSDGVDNDNDGLIDLEDKGCLNEEDDSEEDVSLIVDMGIMVVNESKVISPGESVKGRILITKVGNVVNLDINLRCGIEDKEGNVYDSDEINLVLNERLELFKELNVSSAMDGTYYFVCYLEYDNKIMDGRDSFRVIKEEYPEVEIKEERRFDYKYLVIGLIILIAIGVIYFVLRKYLKRKKKKKRYRKKRR